MRITLFFSMMSWAVAATPKISLPLSFEPNIGQTDSRVKYLARNQNATLWLTSEGPVLGIQHKSQLAVVKVRFQGASRAPRIDAEDRRGGVTNYFIGNDPSKWRTDVPQFGKVRYHDLYPGIDVVFYGNPDQLEYDFVLRPGADPSRIRLAFDGPSHLTRNADGDLILGAGETEFKFHKPVIRQGDRIIDGRYVLRGKRGAAFEVDTYDRTAPLVIDPVLTYASLLGGSIGDQAAGIAMDKQGNIYLVGETSSVNFPTKNGFLNTIGFTTNNPFHAFLTKFNPSASGGASVVYSTLYGSDGIDAAAAVAVDSSGNVVITGNSGSFSQGLPQVNPFQTPP